MTMVCGANWTLAGHSVYPVPGEEVLQPSDLPEAQGKLFQDAIAKLDTLSLDGMGELKRLSNPPDSVKDVMTVVLTLLGQENTDWRPCP